MIIIAAEGNNFSSKVIEWISGYKKSHIALRYGGNRDQWLVHSRTGGVQPAWWERFKEHYINHYTWETNIFVAEYATDNIIKNIGTKDYDNFALYGLGLYILLRRIGIKLSKNPFGNPEKFMCTEVLITWVRECKRLDPTLEIEENFDTELTSVKDVVNFLDSYPQYFSRCKNENSSSI